jgi:hypothetical protein
MLFDATEALRKPAGLVHRTRFERPEAMHPAHRSVSVRTGVGRAVDGTEDHGSRLAASAAHEARVRDRSRPRVGLEGGSRRIRIVYVDELVCSTVSRHRGPYDVIEFCQIGHEPYIASSIADLESCSSCVASSRLGRRLNPGMGRLVAGSG